MDSPDLTHISLANVVSIVWTIKSMSQVNTTWPFKARRNGRCVLGIGKTCQKGFYVSLVSRETEQVVGSNQVILHVYYIVFFKKSIFFSLQL